MSKFHKFWELGLNPITMRKDETELHIHNRSKEYYVSRDRWREAKEEQESFNYINQ